MKTINTDARIAVQALPADERFDLILGDAFNDLSVPYHLTTQEFDRKVQAHLNPTGFYLDMIIDKMEPGPLLNKWVSTSAKTFRADAARASFHPSCGPCKRSFRMSM